MPVFRLTGELVFPHPALADEDGIIAVGGDLSVERLVLAYANGIFPWFNEGDPLLWWSPDPRFILYPQNIQVSKSMRKLLRKSVYSVTFDTCFREVITACRCKRADDTWITDEMLEAYCRLHQAGFAHSVETWHEGKLVGGLYGVSLGKCFCGESMFSNMDNASKIALITLSDKLSKRGFLFIDCQVYTSHLESMGAVNVSRSEFLKLLAAGLEFETLQGNWRFLNNLLL